MSKRHNSEVIAALDKLTEELVERRPYQDIYPDGYLESDRDWFENNRLPVVELMEAIIRARKSE